MAHAPRPRPAVPQVKPREPRAPVVPLSGGFSSYAEDLFSEPLAESTLTSKGQITIPQAIRSMYHLDTGDSLLWRRDREGHLVVEPKRTLTIEDIWAVIEAAGAPKPTRVATKEDVQEAIGKAVGTKYGRH